MIKMSGSGWRILGGILLLVGAWVVQYRSDRTPASVSSDALQDDPCYPMSYRIFPTHALNRILDRFSSYSDTQILETQEAWDRANPDNLPLDPQIAAPAEWKTTFAQLLKCSGSNANIKFGVSKSVGLYVHYPLNQVVVSEVYLNRFNAMPVSELERKELMQFVLAHELSHFILDHAIRSVENKKSPFQSRSSVSIAADFARTSGEEQNAYIDEYNRQHEEVDGVALALLKRCQLPIPTAELFWTKLKHEEPSELAPKRCSADRRRMHHLLEVARGLR